MAPLWEPEACIIGEPSGWDAVTLGYKGRTFARYRREQPVSHSAGPERAVAEYGVEFWNAVVAAGDALNGERPRVFDRLSPALTRIESSSDGLTEAVELDVSWRTPLWFDGPAWRATLAEAAGEEATVDVLEGIPAHRGDKRSPLVRAFLPSIRAAGGKPRFLVKTGSSDMNVVGPGWGCLILAYGPGDSSLDHTPNEHIDLGELARGVAVIQQAVTRFTAAPAPR